jgi:hypothetical protein
MQQIRITRTADLNGVLSFLKERYPLTFPYRDVSKHVCGFPDGTL